MQLGVVLPQNEISADPAAVRAFVQSAEAAGYQHLVVPEHIIGVDPDRPGGWSNIYTHESMWHEPFVLLGYLAAIAPTLEFVTGVLVLPQRQTALVAKQAAQVDILSGGRLRLGVGVGWNAVEYEVLGEVFAERGRRIEEQTELLRRLWIEPVVEFEGRYHVVRKAGINPLPTRQIPIWMGGRADAVLERVGRLADGWFPSQIAPADAAPYLERIRAAAEGSGRDPGAIGIEARVWIGRDVAREIDEIFQWREAGATHVGVTTDHIGLSSPADHIRAIEHFKARYDSTSSA